MSITISCSACKTSLRVAESATGKKVRCPRCKAAIDVPSPPTAGVEPDPGSADADGSDESRQGADSTQNDDEPKGKTRRSKKKKHKHAATGTSKMLVVGKVLAIVLSIGVVVAGGFGIWAVVQKGPQSSGRPKWIVHQGRTTVEWLELANDFSSGRAPFNPILRDEIREASRAMPPDPLATADLLAAVKVQGMGASFAGDVLQRFGPSECKQAVAQLMKGLEDPHPETQRWAMQLLGKAGADAKQALPVISQRAEQGNETAIAALGGLGAEAVPTLLKTLRHKDDRVRNVTATALGRLGNDAQAAVPALSEVVIKDRAVQMSALKALEELGPVAADAVAPLGQLLRGENVPLESRFMVQHGAARALGKIGPPALDVLLAALNHPDNTVMGNAGMGIGLMGQNGAKAVPALMQGLGDARTAPVCARALGEIGTPAQTAIPQLVAGLKPNQANFSAIRDFAEALVKLVPGSKATVRDLIGMLSFGDLDLRLVAVKRLSEHGIAAKEAVPALQHVLAQAEQRIPQLRKEADAAARTRVTVSSGTGQGGQVVDEAATARASAAQQAQAARLSAEVLRLEGLASDVRQLLGQLTAKKPN